MVEKWLKDINPVEFTGFKLGELSTPPKQGGSNWENL
jgi:hypothetical protein